mgnify:CR=1 FL=1
MGDDKQQPDSPDLTQGVPLAEFTKPYKEAFFQDLATLRISAEGQQAQVTGLPAGWRRIPHPRSGEAADAAATDAGATKARSADDRAGGAGGG